MSLAAFFAFIAGAAIGLTMAVAHFRGQESGKAIGIVHGLFTVSGIVLLTVGLATVNADVGWWVLVAFLLTATGGAYLFYRQAKGEPWPGVVIIAHGGLALVSIVLLGLWLATAEPTADEGRDPSVPATTIENEPIPTESLTE